METTGVTIITVEATINASVHQVWKYWTTPEHIIHWNNASDDWHTPWAENDFRAGGSFLSRMEAKDGSFGFDFAGAYNEIKMHELIVYTLFDGRKVHISFTPEGNSTTIIESFEAEDQYSIELQKNGWQSILDNFKRYVESK
ncbi:MAG TPA: polyketide cyclase [Marinilabiliales bacterium]|nr:polyketide cyclase [Marinilabiliales bacterium]